MFPALSIFWSVVILLFVFVPLLLLWLTALVHLIMRSYISAVARVVWLLVTVIVPIFGPVIYFLSRPVDRVEVATSTDQRSTESVADELRKLAHLRHSEVITDEEFARQETRLLA